MKQMSSILKKKWLLLLSFVNWNRPSLSPTHLLGSLVLRKVMGQALSSSFLSMKYIRLLVFGYDLQRWNLEGLGFWPYISNDAGQSMLGNILKQRGFWASSPLFWVIQIIITFSLNLKCFFALVSCYNL